MNKLIRNIALVACMGAVSSQALAGGHHGSIWSWLSQFSISTQKPICKDKPKAVPELDVAGAGLALALTGGLIAISRERRNRK